MAFLDAVASPQIVQHHGLSADNPIIDDDVDLFEPKIVQRQVFVEQFVEITGHAVKTLYT